MRFVTMFWPDMTNMTSAPTGPDTKMMEYSRRSQEGGVLISQGMFAPMATEITLSDGQFTVTESQGEAFGYAYLEAESPADAVRHVKEFLQVAGGGRTLIRQLADGNEGRPK